MSKRGTADPSAVRPERRTDEQPDSGSATEPAIPPGSRPPSQSGYGHKVSKGGSTEPQGGANPVGPETDSAGHKGRTRDEP